MKNCLLIIDAKDRVNGSSADFIYNPQVIGLNKVKSFRVSKVTVPYSFYTIVDQSFQLTVGATVYTIGVLAGNYTAYQLATMLQTNITVAAGPGIAVSYNPTTNNFTVFNSGSANMQFNFDTGSVPTGYELYNVGVAAGFVQVDNLGELYPAAPLITSKYAANMSSTTNIYLRSAALSNYYMSYFRGKKDNIIASIPISVNPYNWIIYSEFTPVFFDFNSTALNSIDFQFLDDSGNVLDFRGLNPIVELDLRFFD